MENKYNILETLQNQQQNKTKNYKTNKNQRDDPLTPPKNKNKQNLTKQTILRFCPPPKSQNRLFCKVFSFVFVGGGQGIVSLVLLVLCGFSMVSNCFLMCCIGFIGIPLVL